MKIGILGSGSWATAIIKVLIHNGHKPSWWIRRKEMLEYISQHQHNPNYLSSTHLPTNKFSMSTSMDEVVEHCDWVIIAIPSYYVLGSLSALEDVGLQSKKVALGIKGLPSDSLKTVSSLMTERYFVAPENLVGLLGPCHAEEVVQEKQSFLSIVANEATVGEEFKQVIENEFLQCTVSNDLVGAEYAAVLKNIYAMVAGVSVGLGMGDNFRARLLSDCMLEMERFLNVLVPKERNMSNAVYLGDLLVTAYSPHSRNRTMGVYLGKGYSPRYAQMEMGMVAEGYRSIAPVLAIGKQHGVPLPIVELMEQITAGNKSAQQLFEQWYLNQ